MKLKVILVLLLTFLFLTSSPALAKKKIVRSSQTVSAPRPYGVWVKPKLRSDHNALILAFGGLDYATGLSYALTYTSAEIPQGVQGNHEPKTQNFQTELLFGTCSGTNCTYHQKITDMLLEVKLKLKTGKTLIQHYQVNL